MRHIVPPNFLVFSFALGGVPSRHVGETKCAALCSTPVRGSDSVTALSMLALMKAGSPHSAVVTRELALTLSDACIRPQVIAHIPGAANRLADSLSRRPAPGVALEIPAALRSVQETLIPPRAPEYYRSV